MYVHLHTKSLYVAQNRYQIQSKHSKYNRCQLDNLEVLIVMHKHTCTHQLIIIIIIIIIIITIMHESLTDDDPVM